MWGHNFLKTSRRSFRRQLDTRRCIKTTWYLWRFFSALYFVPRPPGILPSAVKFLRRLTPYELKNQINFVVRRTRDIGQKNFQTSRPLRSFSKLSFFILDFGYLLQDYFFVLIYLCICITETNAFCYELKANVEINLLVVYLDSFPNILISDFLREAYSIFEIIEVFF